MPICHVLLKLLIVCGVSVGGLLKYHFTWLPGGRGETDVSGQACMLPGFRQKTSLASSASYQRPRSTKHISLILTADTPEQHGGLLI